MAKGLSRDEAYGIVQAASTASLEGRMTFRDALLASGRLLASELETLFDYRPYLQHVDTILARVGIPAREAVRITSSPGASR